MRPFFLAYSPRHYKVVGCLETKGGLLSDAKLDTFMTQHCECHCAVVRTMPMCGSLVDDLKMQFSCVFLHSNLCYTFNIIPTLLYIRTKVGIPLDL